jgi:hypothetical protein
MLAGLLDDLDQIRFKVEPLAARSLPPNETFELWNSGSIRRLNVT